MKTMETVARIPVMAAEVLVSARIPAIILVILIAYVVFRLYRITTLLLHKA
jgi:hypothetical protein